VHIVSSKDRDALDIVKNKRKTLQKWAEEFLIPLGYKTIKSMKELVVPYCTREHWSLFLFQCYRVYHLNSISSKCHNPKNKDLEFIEWVNMGWQTLHGLKQFKPVKNIVSVELF
jgi:hypothetical protein